MSLPRCTTDNLFSNKKLRKLFEEEQLMSYSDPSRKGTSKNFVVSAQEPAVSRKIPIKRSTN